MGRSGGWLRDFSRSCGQELRAAETAQRQLQTATAFSRRRGEKYEARRTANGYFLKLRPTYELRSALAVPKRRELGCLPYSGTVTPTATVKSALSVLCIRPLVGSTPKQLLLQFSAPRSSTSAPPRERCCSSSPFSRSLAVPAVLSPSPTALSAPHRTDAQKRACTSPDADRAGCSHPPTTPRAR